MVCGGERVEEEEEVNVVFPLPLVPSPPRLSLLCFPLFRPPSVGVTMLLAMFMWVRGISILITSLVLSRLPRLSQGVQLLTSSHEMMWQTNI